MSLAVAVNLIPVFLTTLGSALGNAHGLTNEQLGRIGAVTFIGLVSGILITGPLADRFGPKAFAVLGNLLVAAGLAVLGVAYTYNAVLMAVALMGFGAGVLDMVLSPIVCAFQPEQRTTAMNWLHSFYCVGAVTTVLVGAVALRVGIGWRTISLWLILLPVIVAVGFLNLRIPPLIKAGQQRHALRQLCRRPYFLVALAAIFLAGSTELGMAQWLPAYAEKSLHYSKWTGGMALLAFSVAMALGRMIVGMLGTRLRPLPLMAACCWASVLLFLLACFAPLPWVALLASVCVGFTGSCLWPSTLGVTADRFPHGGASMFAMLGAMGNIGGIFMPWVVGIIADEKALNIGIATATFCPLLMALLLIWMQRHGHEPVHADSPIATDTLAADI
ncbi:MAG TPA: MFS transporter [Armatimonadota bacterium]